jgi:hypothetical protein
MIFKPSPWLFRDAWLLVGGDFCRSHLGILSRQDDCFERWNQRGPDRGKALAKHLEVRVVPLSGAVPQLVFRFEIGERIDYPLWSPLGNSLLIDRVQSQGSDLYLLRTSIDQGHFCGTGMKPV